MLIEVNTVKSLWVQRKSFEASRRNAKFFNTYC